MTILLFLLACSSPPPEPAAPPPPPPTLGDFQPTEAPDACDCVLSRGPQEPTTGIVAFAPLTLARVSARWKGEVLRLEGQPKADGDDRVVRISARTSAGTEVDGLLRATVPVRPADGVAEFPATFDGTLTLMDVDDTVTTSFSATCGC